MKKLLSFLLVAIMACSVVPAMAESAAGADTIVIGITSEPAYLEPNAPAIGGTEIHVIDQMFEGLVTMNETTPRSSPAWRPTGRSATMASPTPSTSFPALPSPTVPR